ncbi:MULTISPECIES: hypothetical protein [Acinetobacter]|uniref:Uncharacterized protein n=1 Tax=Acinetobacter haemolyticus TaxID=29430 RepID=A0A429GVP3_ACIHA|nr:hypothetical protein [Acinetobacter haemolyticus]QBQ15260.1 hypothetical protein AHTJR_02725 [Acinetobacter haemolyticus]RSN77839.1 hypothetical protein EA769_03200 [Acinetobacter haemolyticus]
MQTLKAQSRSELADHLRFITIYKGKAVLSHLVFFMILSLFFIAFLFFLDLINGQPYQFHWGYFIVGWIAATTSPLSHQKFRDYRLPFIFEKHFIDQNLVQDLQALHYIKTTATVIDLQIASRAFFKPQLHTITLQLDGSNKIITDQYVHLNLLFQNIFVADSNYTKFYANISWIGQKVEVCFLPNSKRIVQLIGLPEQNNLQHLSSDFLDPLRTRKKLILKDIPSCFAQEFFSIQKIEANRHENHRWQYQLIITSWQQNQYHISTTCPGFTKLELMLANKIDFLKYRQFKQNASIQSQILYQRKIFKRPPLLLKILSINNRIFL